MWTYAPTYNSAAFEFVDEAPGTLKKNSFRPDVPVVGRVPFQFPKARDAKVARKLKKDITEYRKDELRKYPFVENEWNGMGDSHV